MNEELKYRLALTMIHGVGDVLARSIVSYSGGAEQVFRLKKKDLIRIPGIDEVRAKSILAFDRWKEVDLEISFMEKNKIRPLFYLDADYPKRLKNVTDAPIMLFTKGAMDLNAARLVALVGTRHATDYGKTFCELFVEGLKPFGVHVVSGLAYGIDIAAHRAAVKLEMPTIGVLGHGLNRLYPGQHRSTAVKMLENGGLVTEFKSFDAFEPQNFPKRNRIVAGLCDATVVIESAINGGALITAEIAASYQRDVFAVPGNVGEKFSSGCNYFIKHNKASLVESAGDLAWFMGWQDVVKSPVKQKELFIELEPNEKLLLGVLKEKDSLHIDSIAEQAAIPPSQLAAALLGLEFKGIVVCLPGKVYKLA